MVFRIAYFHDPMSNPYYAKATDASWLRIVNFVGGGWSYLTGWLADARTWLIVPLVLIAPLRRASLSHQLAVAICLAHLMFVLFVGGDWMGAIGLYRRFFRFWRCWSSPPSPGAGKRWSRLSSTVGCLVLVWFLGIGTVTQLILFRAHPPTTPTAVVAQIGKTFLELGRRLNIAHPSLAHHDAGGPATRRGSTWSTSEASADRTVAKHMTDRAFMRKYIFEQRRPTFVFGSSKVFAAGETQFFRMPEFDQYVRLRFPGRPFMSADLCYVRRDAIHPVPGVREVKDGTTEYWLVE